MMIEEEYQIEDLVDKLNEVIGPEEAKEREVTSRTIRYYTQEGLLPKPDYRDKHAYYNREHLDRLLLILQLKDRYLPLKEISQIVMSLSLREVQEMLEEEKRRKNILTLPGEQPKILSSMSGSDSALDYIAQLRMSQGEKSVSDYSKGSQDPRSTTAVTPPETWRRILLAPGVELHIKEPLTSQDRERFEQLIRYSRILFSK